MHAGQLAVLSTRWPCMSVQLKVVAGTTPYNIYDIVRAHKRSVAFCRLMATPSPERLGHYTPDEETSVLLDNRLTADIIAIITIIIIITIITIIINTQLFRRFDATLTSRP